VFTSVGGNADNLTDLSNVTLLDTISTESTNNRNALAEAFEAGLHLAGGLGGLGQLALVEDVLQATGKTKHTLVLSINLVGVKTLNRVILPALADSGVEVTGQETEIFVRFDLLPEGGDEGLLDGGPLEVEFLFVDLGEADGQVCEALLDDSNILVVGVSALCALVL